MVESRVSSSSAMPQCRESRPVPLRSLWRWAIVLLIVAAAAGVAYVHTYTMAWIPHGRPLAKTTVSPDGRWEARTFIVHVGIGALGDTMQRVEVRDLSDSESEPRTVFFGDLGKEMWVGPSTLAIPIDPETAYTIDVRTGSFDYRSDDYEPGWPGYVLRLLNWLRILVPALLAGCVGFGLVFLLPWLLGESLAAWVQPATCVCLG